MHTLNALPEPAGPIPPSDPADTEAPSHLKRAEPLFSNAQMGPNEIHALRHPCDPVTFRLRAAIQHLGLSARAYDVLHKVAKTIAGCGGDAEMAPAHVARAIQY